jgi:hypothetical protein
VIKTKKPTKADLKDKIKELRARQYIGSNSLNILLLAEAYLESGCLKSAEKEIKYVSNVLNVLDRKLDKLKESEGKGNG